MRRNLFLVLALFMALCINVRADIDLKQVTEEEYLINNGYSELITEEVLISKQRAAGEAVEPLYEQKHCTNRIVRFLKKCHTYLDPAMEDDFKYHHDMHMSPGFNDL